MKKKIKKNVVGRIAHKVLCLKVILNDIANKITLCIDVVTEIASLGEADFLNGGSLPKIISII